MRTMKHLAIAAMAATALALAGCGGGGSSPSTAGQVQPTPYETAKMAIAAATTDAAVDKAVADAVAAGVSGADLRKLDMAAGERKGALATMARANTQKMALMDAAGMIDTSEDALSTQEGVDAAREAIAGLRGALAAADDVSDADKAMYETRLENAEGAVDTAQGGLDTAMRRTNQMMALSDASDDLQAALAALSGSTPTQAQLNAANNARDALKMAITDAKDLTDAEKATYQREADNAAAPINTAQTAFDDAEDDADDKRRMAMMATAMKLHAGISAPTSTDANTADTDAATGTRFAGYVTVADTPTGASVGDIVVGISDNDDVALSEDKKTMVSANYDWEGKRYHRTMPASDGTYEARVYSNVGDPTEGDPFNEEYTPDATTGEVAIDQSDTTNHPTSRVASPSFDQSAGVKTFKLPTNTVRIMLSGSYYGVSGTYYCTPATGNLCAAQVAASGFNLGGAATDGNAFTAGGGTWTFKPTDPMARVTSMPDDTYASYGWWIHKSADDKTYTASAFVSDKGTVPDASGITALQGTAKYMGGAAGKYALYSSTGGTNDAGHFTARAMLEADFGDDMISGTIDMFMGADGKSRNWSVELMEQGIGDTGTILGDDGTGDAKMTKWTIDGTAGAADGQWSGSLQDNDDGGVPKVGTGTFYSTYGNDGKMVGAFGVTKQ